jgi:hypothetical protein
MGLYATILIDENMKCVDFRNENLMELFSMHEISEQTDESFAKVRGRDLTRSIYALAHRRSTCLTDITEGVFACSHANEIFFSGSMQR